MKPLAVPKDVEVVTGFALKVALGSAAFFVVAVVAVALKFGLNRLEAMQPMPAWFKTSADIIELVIWVADVIVYALFLLNELREAVLSTLGKWREPHG